MESRQPAKNPDEYVRRLRGWHRETVEAIRTAVSSVKGLEETIKWGHPVYFSSGPVLLIRAERDRILFGFWRGQRLVGIEPRLKSSGKYEMATLELRDGTTVKPTVVRRLALKAVALNKRLGDPTKAAKGGVGDHSKPESAATGTARAGKPRKSAATPKSPAKTGATEKHASRLIDQRIRDLGGWRGEALARMRALILEADPEMTEEWKWGTPVWSHHGIVCTGEAYTKVVKLTFARGSRIPDPSRLFNSSLEGNTRRAIDIHEGEKVDVRAFKALVRAAVAQNGPPSKKAGPARGLSGGNPQIAKADGDAPVQAYIAAMPGWKRDVGRRLDALIVRNVPNLCKAVKWNSPFYGIEGRGWFLSFHVFTHYVKVAFFRGASLRPVPPGPSKDQNTRYLDIREGNELDEAQMANWVKQAATLPGWVPGRPY